MHLFVLRESVRKGEREIEIEREGISVGYNIYLLTYFELE